MKSIIIFAITTILFFLVSAKLSPIQAQTLTSFGFDNFTSGGAKIAGLPFSITLTARDENGNRLTSFNDRVSLTDSTGSIYPIQTTNFSYGNWTGNVYITEATPQTVIIVSYATIDNSSVEFTVDPDTRIKFVTVTSGNNQYGAVNSQLPLALSLMVVDPFNNPIPNVGVNFTITSYPTGATGQLLSVNSATSTIAGGAATSLTMGRKTGTYIVSASLGSGVTNTVSYYENAVPDVLTSIGITPAVAVIPIGGYLPLTATGYDQFANVVPITPSWSVINEGGTIDSTGVFYAGQSVGTYLNTVRAVYGSVGGTATVTLIDTGVVATASATPTALPTPTATTSTAGTGVLASVVIDPSVVAALKNSRIPIVATGVDAYGNAVANVNFTFEVSGDLGTLTQTAADTVLLTVAESGVGTVTVTATQGNIVRVAKVVGSVGTGLNRRLIIEPVQTPQRVNEPFTISIAAKDSLNNFLTDYTGPIALADTTGTIDPALAEPNDQGIWYVQAIIRLGHPQITVTVAGDGMIGVSNIFAVEGEPKFLDVGPGGGAAAAAAGGGGLSEIMGASISGKIAELLKLNKFSIVRYLAAGIAAGLGILGASIGGGIMASRGLEAIGRNPFAKAKVKANLYLSIGAFVLVALLSVLAAFLIVK